MDIIISERLLAGAPALWYRPAEGDASRRPLIVLFHRFMISAALDANLGYMLARAGYSVVCPQAALHGANDDPCCRQHAFWQILQHTLDTLPALLSTCQQVQLGDATRAGVMGTSMGGFAVLGAMVRYPGLRAGAAYMASGYFADALNSIHPPQREDIQACLRGLAPYDATGKKDRLAQRPLFLWHGGQDNIVDVRHTVRLREALGHGNALTCVIDPQAGHKITQLSVESGVDFFRRSLPI